MNEGGRDATGPGEERLRALLELLREDPPGAGQPLVGAVMRKVRWQRPLRSALVGARALAGAFVDGLSLVLRGRR